MPVLVRSSAASSSLQQYIGPLPERRAFVYCMAALSPRFVVFVMVHTSTDATACAAAFLVVADEAYGRQIPFAFLERVRAEFQEKFAERAHSATAHSLDKAVGWVCLSRPRSLGTPLVAQACVRTYECVLATTVLQDCVLLQELRSSDEAGRLRGTAAKVRRAPSRPQHPGL